MVRCRVGKVLNDLLNQVSLSKGVVLVDEELDKYFAHRLTELRISSVNKIEKQGGKHILKLRQME